MGIAIDSFGKFKAKQVTITFSNGDTITGNLTTVMNTKDGTFEFKQPNNDTYIINESQVRSIHAS
jgi:hypothetical protein